ncbi:MAG TPA: N-acetyl sugar amidotransferase [Thermoanaerobaculia bacterium]|nr:N-acetyl sugar amidotransferase [Thermoanaerobaculia bacterium]
MRRCSRCIYPESIPAITFDEKGVCSYCHTHDALAAEYPIGEAGARRLKEISNEIREAGRGKRYDVIVGVSGGCDSTFMLLKARELGLRPLAVHFDNTWDSTIAVQNIHNALKKLDIDLFTYVVDNEEYDDIYRSFLQAGVADIEAPTDIGLAVTLYKACEKYGVKYMFEGHSFRTEGISPLGWLYMDGKYIESVQKQYGTRPLRTFPNLKLYSFIKWTAFSGIKKIRPLYYMEYHKEETKELLGRELGWQWYGGHHLENRFTAFFHSYFFPKRWGYDGRLLGEAALVRSGQITREQALAHIAEPQSFDPELIELVKKRLGYTDEEFTRLMNLPKRTYREFRTYKKTFERLRPLFYILYKMDRVPKSFFMKFTAPDPPRASFGSQPELAVTLEAQTPAAESTAPPATQIG